MVPWNRPTSYLLYKFDGKPPLYQEQLGINYIRMRLCDVLIYKRIEIFDRSRNMAKDFEKEFSIIK